MARAGNDIAGRHQEGGAAAPMPSGAMPDTSASARGTPLASNPGPAHPCLIQLVRLMARQAAAEDIARQRAAAVKGE